MAKLYPVLYVTSVQGTLFKHCSIHPTLYFKVHLDEKLSKTDEFYLPYMKKIQEECYNRIIGKFTFSQALKVTNNKIPFIIFRGNIDIGMVKQYCQVLLDEISFHTKKEHVADFMTLDTMFMQIDKQPTFLKAGSVGKKLSETDFMKDHGSILDGLHDLDDHGQLTPFYDFKYPNLKKEQEAESDEVVVW